MLNATPLKGYEVQIRRYRNWSILKRTTDLYEATQIYNEWHTRDDYNELRIVQVIARRWWD